MGDSAIALTEHQVVTKGRRIVVWHVPGTREDLPPIVLAPGFGRRMDHLCAVALYLAQNGFEVYRYDGLDHVGASDGTMTAFTMTSALDSLRAVVDWVCETRGIASVGVCAMSLGARVAYRLAATSERVRFLATAVGVVHLRRTLHCVWGEDLAAMTDAELPDYVEFEKKYIGTHRFAHDARARSWMDLDTTIAELARARAPIACFASLDDEWVATSDLRAAFEEKGAGRRHIVEMEGGVHDIGQNPAAARIFVGRLVATALDLAGAKADVQEPRFDALVEQALLEGRRQRAVAVASRSPAPSGRILRMLPPGQRPTWPNMPAESGIELTPRRIAGGAR